MIEVEFKLGTNFPNRAAKSSNSGYRGLQFIPVLVDNFSYYCYAIRIRQSIKGINVVEVKEQIKHQSKTVPKRIQVDNGSEFISKDFDKWAYENNVTLDYSRPGKPTDNPFIELLNGSVRDECLNTNWFLSMEDATEKIEIPDSYLVIKMVRNHRIS